MEINIFQIDAFASQCFKGNPAAVCPLDSWLADDILQKIAEENNLSETAFFVKEQNGYHIRWFTPSLEIDLCGHATLASAYVIFNILGYDADKIMFQSRSGLLVVGRDKESLVLDFPVSTIKPVKEVEILSQALGKTPVELWKTDDYMAVFESEEDILTLAPNFQLLKELDCRGIIVTSKGNNVDFVSRFFAPACGIDEDPVTGSAHCALTPYWSKKLNKTKLSAKQLSQRGGDLFCEVKGDRVLISGQAVKYLEGKLFI